MSLAWLYVILSGLLEIPWVIGLKNANTVFEYAIVALIIATSFFLLMRAYKHLPVSVTYAIFTGIGTVGIVIVEIIMAHSSVSITKIIFVLMILCGVIGLKLTTKEH